MKANYYDPLFYICSEEMPFTIRIEITLRGPVLPDCLQHAVDRAMERYPYFAMRVTAEDGEYLAAENAAPVVVYPGPEVRPLGGSEVNHHLLTLSYDGRRICVFASHVITDGAGLYPFIKTVLYYYFSAADGTAPEVPDVRLAGEPLLPDEAGNPYPEEEMRRAKPLYVKTLPPFFRLREGGFVTDSAATVYRCRIRKETLMRFSFDHDGSPCSLVSALMAKAVRSLHPEEHRSIVSAVSFNLRPGLGNAHSYRMLCSSIALDYPDSTRDWSIARLCTCSRGMVTLQSQRENVLYYAQQRRERFEALEVPGGLSARRAAVGQRALEDSVRNTFSVSYVGELGFGSMESRIDSIYNITDGSTYQTLFIEIAALNDWFYFAFIQGFSSDRYYRAFLEQLRLNGLPFTEADVSPLETPKMLLP